MPDPIFLYEAIRQTPRANRPELVKALRKKKIPTTSTEAPWMVELADVQAYVAANSVLFPAHS